MQALRDDEETKVGSMRRFAMVITAILLALGLFPLPAGATVHEIVGQWCAGRGDLLPPGITGGSNADNLARPLFASGFAAIEEFDPGDGSMAVLIDFDFDHPAAKIVGTGEIVLIDELPDGTAVFAEAFVLDTTHGFAHCARLRD